MVVMSLRPFDVSQPQRRAKTVAATGRVRSDGAHVVAIAAPAPAAKLPPRPDPSILNEAIPVYFIGQNSDGQWVARAADSATGGIFLMKRSAIRFANRSAPGCAIMFLSDPLELDVENKGNLLLTRWSPVKQASPQPAPAASGLPGKFAAGLRTFVARSLRARADKRAHREAIERELFQGRYRLMSKNDDDLPIVS